MNNKSVDNLLDEIDFDNILDELNEAVPTSELAATATTTRERPKTEVPQKKAEEQADRTSSKKVINLKPPSDDNCDMEKEDYLSYINSL